MKLTPQYAALAALAGGLAWVANSRAADQAVLIASNIQITLPAARVVVSNDTLIATPQATDAEVVGTLKASGGKIPGAKNFKVRDLGPSAVSRQTQLLEEELKLAAGILEEEMSLDLSAAIHSYQTLITQFDGQRPLAASALFRLGECYRKLGRMDEAKAQYHRVLREFSDQTVLTKLCQKYLSAQPGATGANGLSAAGGFASATTGSGAGRLPLRDVRAQLDDLDLAHAKSCLDLATNQAAKIAWEMRTVRQTDVLSLPTLAEESHQRQMDRFKSEYEKALRPAVSPPGGTNRVTRSREQRGDVVKRMETWVKEIYLPEQEVNLRLVNLQAGRWSNEIQRTRVALQAYLKRHPDAPSVHRPGANPSQVEDLLQRLERVRTEAINLLRPLVAEEAILAAATNAPPEALSQQILGKWYWDYKSPDFHLLSQSAPQKFESIKTNMAAWLKDDFLPEKERSLREMRADYTRQTNEVAKLEAELEEVRDKSDGPSLPAAASAAKPDRLALEGQLADARKEEINARKEMANQESLLRTAQECLKLAPQSEPAKADLARVENDLRSAKAQQLLWSAEVARLEARLKEQPTPSPDLVVKVFALRYAQASEAAATLQPLLASDFKIVADTRTNALLVHGPESKFAALEEVIRKLDAVTTNSPSPGKKP